MYVSVGVTDGVDVLLRDTVGVVLRVTLTLTLTETVSDSVAV